MTVALWVVVAAQTVGLIVLTVMLIVSRRSLSKARRAVGRRHGDDPGRRRRPPIGVAPLAVRTVMNTEPTAHCMPLSAIVFMLAFLRAVT